MTTDPSNIYTQAPPQDARTFGYWMRQAAADYPAVTHQIIQAGINAATALAAQGANAAYAIFCAAWLEIVEAIDEDRRDHCSNCHGAGTIPDYEDNWSCQACAPFADEME